MTPAPTRKRSGLRQREETRAHLDAHGMCDDWPKPPIWPGDLPLLRGASHLSPHAASWRCWQSESPRRARHF